MHNSTRAVQLRRRLTVAIVPGLVTLLVVTIAFLSILRLRESRRWIEHTHRVHDTLALVLAQVVNAETSVRAYVISGDSGFLETSQGAESLALTGLRQLRSLTADNPLQRQRLPLLERLVDERFTAFELGVRMRREQGPSFAPMPDRIRLARLKMDSLRAVVATMDAQEQQLLVKRDKVDRDNLYAAGFIISVGGLIAVIVSALANTMLSQTIGRLGQANADLFVQAQRLEEQATELESQAAELEATAVELEASNVELEEQATELHEQRDLAFGARAEAEQANAAKSRFLSVMSHELRTPLNAIVGYVDIIDAEVHGAVSDDQREDLRRIRRAVSQLTSVINDILNFAKLEAGEVRFDIGPVEMRDALAIASSLMEPQAAAKGVHFNYLPCPPGVIAWADRERVQQIILNLLSNGVKYTNPGGSVQLACSYDDVHVRVRVSDTGRGIAARDVKRIFDPFVQLLGGAHAPSEGVGLGLAISRDLARGMGGDITVTSMVGQGSTFELLLPAAVYASDQVTDGPSGHTHTMSENGDSPTTV